MRVKIFSSQEDASTLEAEINKWLENNGNIQIGHVKQSYAYGGAHAYYTLISIWYTVR